MALMVKSVEFVEVTQDSSSTLSTIDLTKGQNYQNCVPFMTLHGCSDYMDSHCMDVYFGGTVSSGVINFQRNEARSCAMYIKCFVVEFEPTEVKVQQGSFTALPGGTTTYYTTPSSFTKNKTAMVHYWQSTSGSQRWDIHLVRGRVDSNNNGTEVDMYRNEAGGTVSGHYFLFEDISAGNDHFSVYHYNSSLTSGVTSHNRQPTLDYRDPTKTFVIGSYACSDGGATYNDRQTCRMWSYFRGFWRVDRSYGGGTIWYNFQYIKFNDESKVYVVHQDTYSMGSGTTTTTLDFDRAANLNLAAIVSITPMGQSRGNTTSAVQNDSLWTSMKFNSSTQLQFQRNSDGGGNTSYWSFSVVDWGGAVVNTGSNPDPLDPDISFVKSVENFRMTVSRYLEQRDLTKGQDLENCIIMGSQRGSGTNNEIRECMAQVYIREPGVVVAHRPDAGGSVIADISVIEFYPDQVRVEQGVWTMSSTGTETVTLASGVASTDRAFVVSKWESNDATYWSRNAVRTRFVDTDTVEFYRSNSGNIVEGTFFVVEDLQDNFRVKHSIGSTTGTVVNVWDYTPEAYYGYYQCLPLASYAVSTDAYYTDRGTARAYQVGNGSRAIMQRIYGGNTMYSSHQFVRFLDERNHTSPMAPTQDTSTTTSTQGVRGQNEDNRHRSLSLYNPMMSSVGRSTGTGSDDMKGAFHTYRFTTDNTVVEMTRQAAVGITLYPSYGGYIDWIGYSHPDADEKHQLNYAYPTRSLVRSVEKFTSASSRLNEYYLRKGQRPENCVPFGSWRVGANANEIDRLMRHYHIQTQTSRLITESDGSGVGGDLEEVVYVVEFDPDQVRVQQIRQLMTGTSYNIDIPIEVDLTKTFMWFTYNTDHWGNRWEYAAVTGKFNSSTQLNFSRDAASNGVFLDIYLIECLQDQWYVSRDDDGSEANTNVYSYGNFRHGVKGRLIQGSYSMSNADYYPDRNCWRLYPRADHGFQWNRQYSGGNMVSRHLEICDFHPDAGIRVGGYWIDIPGGSTSEAKSVVTTPVLDLERSIVMPTITNCVNRVDGTGADDTGAVCCRLELRDTGDYVDITKYDKGIYTYGWFQWVEWPEFKTHYFEGTTSERSAPISRQVACFRADTNELMDSTTSVSGTGFYHLETTYDGPHYIVCQDDAGGTDYNHLILGKMEPHPLPTFSGGEIIYG